jgi:hypothetical protein
VYLSNLHNQFVSWAHYSLTFYFSQYRHLKGHSKLFAKNYQKLSFLKIRFFLSLPPSMQNENKQTHQEHKIKLYRLTKYPKWKLCILTYYTKRNSVYSPSKRIETQSTCLVCKKNPMYSPGTETKTRHFCQGSEMRTRRASEVYEMKFCILAENVGEISVLAKYIMKWHKSLKNLYKF